jgi:hypothetical protein
MWNAATTPLKVRCSNPKLDPRPRNRRTRPTGFVDADFDKLDEVLAAILGDNHCALVTVGDES